MFCAECGENLNENAKFCFKCGGKQPEKETPEEATEAESPKKKCASCDTDLQDNWILCPSCGAKVGKNKPASVSKPASILPDMVETKHAVISSNGKYLAVVVENELKIVDANTREVVGSAEWKEWKKIAAVSTDGIYVALLGETYCVLNVQNGETISFPKLGELGPAEFSHDCKRLAYVQHISRPDDDDEDNEDEDVEEDEDGCENEDDGFGTRVFIVDLPNGNELLSIGIGRMPQALAYSPNGCYLTVGDSGMRLMGMGVVKVLNASTGDQLHALSSPSSHVAFSHDGKKIVTVEKGGVIKVWDAKNGKKLLECTERQDEFSTDTGIARFSPDGKFIVVGYQMGMGGHLLNFGKGIFNMLSSMAGDSASFAKKKIGLIQIFDAKTGKMLKHFKEDGNIKWVSYSPDGKAIISYTGNQVKFQGNVWTKQ